MRKPGSGGKALAVLRFGWFLAAVLTPLVGSSCWRLSTARAQGPNRPSVTFHPDSSYTAETLLRNAANHVRDQQWSEAIDLYEKVIQQFGESVALVPRGDPAADPSGESLLYVDARQHCQRSLAALPPEARAIYRQRVDARAEQLYRQGAARRDPAALRQVVSEMFCSSWGDDALNLLGDLAFQRGQFGEALAAYRRLVPDGEEGGNALVYPDPEVDLAVVAAKKLLCRAAIGTNPPVQSDLDAFAKAYPGAKDRLAGRQGLLVDILKSSLAEDHLTPVVSIDGRWPTFAGSPTRNRIVPGPVDVGSFQWKDRLEPPPDNRPQFVNSPFGRSPVMGRSTSQDLIYHPIVLGNQVVVCDEDKIVAYHLDARPTGTEEEVHKLVVAWEQRLQSAFGTSRTARTGLGSPRYTLTASGDRIFARLGPVGGRGGGGTLVAVRNNREVEGKLLWKRQASDIALPKQRANGIERFSASYEGTPVADDRHVYVALTEAVTETWSYVACLDAETGETVWVRYLGNASSAFDPMRNMQLASDIGHRLLTLDGQTVYYQTNMGAVAALDAETGAVKWLATYPTRERDMPMIGQRETHRDLNPAIVHDGLVIVAPDDSTPIFAFDAASGRLAWKTDALPRVVHLLGVAKGHLIATGDRVYSIDVKTGKVLRYWPESGSGFEEHGRGLLAGDSIYWPTKTEIHVLDQATGVPVDREPIRLYQAFNTSGGNLAVGDGYLVVAGREELTVFCQNSRLIERYREEIVREPEKASNHYQLARLAEATGQDELALASLEQAVKLAKPADLADGQPLAEVAMAREHHLLMKLAAKAEASNDWITARRHYEQAIHTARSDRDRLTARLNLAEAQSKSGAADKAVSTLQDLLNDERLSVLSVPADDRRTVRADLLIADRLAALIRDRGREVYAPYDREAERLLSRGEKEKNPHLLREVGRSFPVARVAPQALLALGRLCETLGRPSEAAGAYKRLLAIAPTDVLRARALWGLGQAYESQGFLSPARDTYSDVDLKPFGLSGTVGMLATERLSGEPFLSLSMGGAEPKLPLPMVRLWTKRWEGEVRPLAADGVPPSIHSARIFVARGSILRPVDPTSGDSAWEADLGSEPVWVGYLTDLVLAATPTRLTALNLKDGQPRWTFDPTDPRGQQRKTNPFARAEPREELPPASLGRLHGFRIVGSRVYCLRGDRELLALDADSGQLDWSYAPGSGGINPHVLVSPQRVVLQVGKSNAIVVLDTDRGLQRAEYHGDKEQDPWTRDPLPIDDDRVLLVLDPRTVALFDLDRGAEVWTFRDDSALPRAVPPRLFVDSGRLLVLFGGNAMVRLDPNSGAPLWNRGLGLNDLSDWPDGFAIDGERIFCASGNTLTAYALSSGEPVWTRHLTGPQAGWAVALSERYVAAYPSPSRSLEGPLAVLPVIFCLRDTGAPVQRLLFSAPVSALTVRLDTHAALVATQERLWALGESTNRTP